MHHLEGDRAVQPVVVGLVDGGHAATRVPAAHAVPPVEKLPDERVGDGRVHGGSLRGRGLVARLGRASPAHLNRARRAITLSTYRFVSGNIPRSRTLRSPW